MNEQEEFFSTDHKRLLSIATWAKYLAWGAIVYYIVRAMLVIIQYQVDLQRMYLLNRSPPGIVDLTDLFRFDPVFYSIDMISNIASAVVGGGIYYLALKGISLGLNMIVETDINYRENAKQELGNEQ